MITLDCEQGTDQWLQARLGIPTASCFSKITKSDGNKSSSQKNYLFELIAEKIEGVSEGFKSDDMQRGNDLEETARLAYEFVTAHEVEQVGGIYLDEKRKIMCSPDGIIKNLKKGLEIKCPKLKTHIQYCMDGVLPTAYKMQVMGALWITGYETWDFVSYHPSYKQNLFILEVKRDEKLIEKMSKNILAFSEKLEAMKE